MAKKFESPVFSEITMEESFALDHLLTELKNQKNSPNRYHELSLKFRDLKNSIRDRTSFDIYLGIIDGEEVKQKIAEITKLLEELNPRDYELTEKESESIGKILAELREKEALRVKIDAVEADGLRTITDGVCREVGRRTGNPNSYPPGLLEPEDKDRAEEIYWLLFKLTPGDFELTGEETVAVDNFLAELEQVQASGGKISPIRGIEIYNFIKNLYDNKSEERRAPSSRLFDKDKKIVQIEQLVDKLTRRKQELTVEESESLNDILAELRAVHRSGGKIDCERTQQLWDRIKKIYDNVGGREDSSFPFLEDQALKRIEEVENLLGRLGTRTEEEENASHEGLFNLFDDMSKKLN